MGPFDSDQYKPAALYTLYYTDYSKPEDQNRYVTGRWHNHACNTLDKIK